LFERWKNCGGGVAGGGGAEFPRHPEEREWASTELRNALRSIEWDLEDLEDTVNIVEKNPTKFRIDAAELSVRKKFILQTKEEVRVMKARANQVVNTASNQEAVSVKDSEFDPKIISGSYICPKNP
jgi:hypothetical protein